MLQKHDQGVIVVVWGDVEWCEAETIIWLKSGNRFPVSITPPVVEEVEEEEEEQE